MFCFNKIEIVLIYIRHILTALNSSAIKYRRLPAPFEFIVTAVQRYSLSPTMIPISFYKSKRLVE